MRPARERLAQRPRHRCTAGLVGHLRILSQEFREGAHDLAPFEIRLSAIGPLSRGVPPQENPLVKALAITLASLKQHRLATRVVQS